jgi:hypothetical protein
MTERSRGEPDGGDSTTAVRRDVDSEPIFMHPCSSGFRGSPISTPISHFPQTTTAEASMSISGIPSPSNSYFTSPTNGSNSFRTDFSQLADALNSGDLSGARSAFAALQQLQPGRFGAASSSSASGASATSPISTDIATLSKALQSGDLTGAQAAFQKLQQDRGATQQGHHHHHHKRAGGVDSTSNSTATAPASTTQGPTPVDGSIDALGSGQNGVIA